MKRATIILTILLAVVISYGQQHYVVVVKYTEKSKGVGCRDGMMSEAKFATVKEAIAHSSNAFKENKSRDVSVYRITDKQVGIIYEWKVTSGNHTCTHIAVVDGKDQTSAMKALEKHRSAKKGVKIIGFLNVAGKDEKTLMDNFIKTGL